MSQHTKNLTAQIDSVKAYVSTLPEATQQDIVASLGERAFSAPAVAGNDGAVGIPPEQILPTLEKAVEALEEMRK